jgi:hypothetical protein
MRLSRASWVISCVLTIAGCDSGGGGDGGAGGGSGFLGSQSGTSGGSNAGASGAAGSSGTGGPVDVDTGLPPAKTLGTITAAEAQSLCNSLTASAQNALSGDQLRRFTCTISALPASIRQSAGGMSEIDRAACEQMVTECLMEPDDTTNDNDCENTQLSTSVAGCQATVSELEACLNASLMQLRSLFDRFDCGTPVSELMMGGGFEEPAACGALDMKCPGVLDDIGEDTEVLPGEMSEDSGGVAGTGGTP